MIVWNKGHGAMGVKWRSQHELICWGARGTFDPGWGMGNVLTVPRTRNNFHPTEKPVELVGFLVKMSPPVAPILDPFMGSGTTGVAALKCGRQFIGIEIDDAHFETARRRIEDAHQQGDMFVEQKAEQPSLITDEATSR
jgi:site-specific DNA-methyltransferase (adenine-specific)